MDSGLGEQRPCTCNPALRNRYRARVSGPLLDRLDLLLTYGTLSRKSRRAIRAALEDPVIDPAIRVPLAISLILISPDYAVID